MNTQHVMDAVRRLEVERSVTAAHLARVLDTTPEAIQAALDVLVSTGALRMSMLQCRPHAGTDFTTRTVWYHTPEREATARFGSIFDPCGPHHEVPVVAAPTLTTLAS
jgi:hypothetical protein